MSQICIAICVSILCKRYLLTQPAACCWRLISFFHRWTRMDRSCVMEDIMEWFLEKFRGMLFDRWNPTQSWPTVLVSYMLQNLHHSTGLSWLLCSYDLIAQSCGRGGGLNRNCSSLAGEYAEIQCLLQFDHGIRSSHSCYAVPNDKDDANAWRLRGLTFELRREEQLLLARRWGLPLWDKEARWSDS